MSENRGATAAEAETSNDVEGSEISGVGAETSNGSEEPEVVGVETARAGSIRAVSSLILGVISTGFVLFALFIWIASQSDPYAGMYFLISLISSPVLVVLCVLGLILGLWSAKPRLSKTAVAGCLMCGLGLFIHGAFTVLLLVNL